MTYIIFFSYYLHMAPDANHHITPAQTGHVRLCFMQRWQLWRNRFAALVEWKSSGSLIIDHQLQAVPAALPGVMGRADP